ncbi:MAG: hypothetical protein IJ711_03305, partial [Lachnospiraceae bacterium]|nr:hypothetical protein [Lachnospiraceae bacterium]
MKKRIRAAAITGTAVALCAGMIFGVQARRNILNSTKPYAAKDEFKILEIVPSHDGHENEEIGYFVGDSTTDRADFMNVCKAKSLGGRSSSTVVGSDEYKQEMENLLNMRKYGLIKYEGVDRGAYNVDVSEYPVYSKNANFIKNRADGYVAMGNEYSRGIFAMSADNSGGYFLKYGYEIDSDGTIYKLKTETVSVNSVTVSENGVSSNTVTYVDQVVHDYAVPEGDADNQQLPEGLEVHYDDGLQLYTGNVAFEESETGKYYGYALSDYYVKETASADNDFYNGEWFKEFVLGNRESTKSVDVKTVKASSVTAAMLTDTDGKEAYDLIYISGTYDDYNAAGEDFGQDVVVKLFNLATHPDYQAVIMDYALLGPSSGVNPTNIEKLALMLWQTDQGALIDSNKTLFGADSNLNVTTLPTASNVVWSEFG